MQSEGQGQQSRRAGSHRKFSNIAYNAKGFKFRDRLFRLKFIWLYTSQNRDEIYKPGPFYEQLNRVHRFYVIWTILYRLSYKVYWWGFLYICWRAKEFQFFFRIYFGLLFRVWIDWESYKSKLKFFLHFQKASILFKTIQRASKVGSLIAKQSGRNLKSI